MIMVDEEGLARLREALATAGSSYKSNLDRLKNLIDEIVSGDIQGDPARDFLAKFQMKQDIFDGIKRTIDEAEEYVGLKNTQFNNMLGSLSKGMK